MRGIMSNRQMPGDQPVAETLSHASEIGYGAPGTDGPSLDAHYAMMLREPAFGENLEACRSGLAAWFPEPISLEGWRASQLRVRLMRLEGPQASVALRVGQPENQGGIGPSGPGPAWRWTD